MRRLRLAYGRIFHEANASSPLTTTREHFEQFHFLERDAECLALRALLPPLSPLELTRTSALHRTFRDVDGRETDLTS